MERVIRLRLFILGFLLCCVLLVYLAPILFAPVRANLLSVTFLDVGQGDAIFITTPDNVQVLIDGGPSSSVLPKLSRHMSIFDKKLDMVIGTHQDLDHIAGLIDVFARYVVDTVVLTEGEGESQAAEKFVADALAETDSIIYARAGQVFSLGVSTSLTVLSPKDNPALLETNTGSIVALLTHGSTSFLLTGDAPQGIEEYIVDQYGTHIQADVLKLGHHGSDTSSSALFLETVAPSFAVVSAGRDNRYGHPHPDVLERVETYTNARILSTAALGSITLYSDGVTVWEE